MHKVKVCLRLKRNNHGSWTENLLRGSHKAFEESLREVGWDLARSQASALLPRPGNYRIREDAMEITAFGCREVTRMFKRFLTSVLVSSLTVGTLAIGDELQYSQPVDVKSIGSAQAQAFSGNCESPICDGRLANARDWRLGACPMPPSCRSQIHIVSKCSCRPIAIGWCSI